MEYDNTNKGALFSVDKKETEKHPDYTGSVNIGGKEYWLSGWKNKAKDTGKTYLALTIKEKESAPRQSSESTRKAKVDIIEDDCPF
jgi:uncharacterized protein (DUF736 family)